MKHNVANSII